MALQSCLQSDSGRIYIRGTGGGWEGTRRIDVREVIRIDQHPGMIAVRIARGGGVWIESFDHRVYC